MYSQEAVVNNQVGLHARPATFFIQKANEFKSAIWVEKDERKVNAKSLLGVLPRREGSGGGPVQDDLLRFFRVISPSTMKRRRHAAPFLIFKACTS